MINYLWPLAKQMGIVTLTVVTKFLLIGLSISLLNKGFYFFIIKIEQRLSAKQAFQCLFPSNKQ